MIKPKLKEKFINEKKYPVQASTWILENLDIENMSGYIELALLDETTIKADYDTVYITAYDVFVVDEVRSTSQIVTSKIDTYTIKSNRISLLFIKVEI